MYISDDLSALAAYADSIEAAMPPGVYAPERYKQAANYPRLYTEDGQYYEDDPYKIVMMVRHEIATRGKKNAILDMFDKVAKASLAFSVSFEYTTERGTEKKEYDFKSDRGCYPVLRRIISSFPLSEILSMRVTVKSQFGKSWSIQRIFNGRQIMKMQNNQGRIPCVSVPVRKNLLDKVI